MNVRYKSMTVARTLPVRTLQARISASVLLDSQEMASSVRMWMNASKNRPFVETMRNVSTLRGIITANVQPDMLETEEHASVR